MDHSSCLPCPVLIPGTTQPPLAPLRVALVTPGSAHLKLLLKSFIINSSWSLLNMAVWGETLWRKPKFILLVRRVVFVFFFLMGGGFWFGGHTQGHEATPSNTWLCAKGSLLAVFREADSMRDETQGPCKRRVKGQPMGLTLWLLPPSLKVNKQKTFRCPTDSQQVSFKTVYRV